MLVWPAPALDDTAVPEQVVEVVDSVAAAVGTHIQAAAARSHVAPALAPAIEVVAVQKSPFAAALAAADDFEHIAPVAQLAAEYRSVVRAADCTAAAAAAAKAVRADQAVQSELAVVVPVVVVAADMGPG